MSATFEVIEIKQRANKCETDNGGCDPSQLCKYDDDGERICFCGANFEESGGKCVAKVLGDGEGRSQNSSLFNPPIPDEPNWRISVFQKRLYETENFQ